MYFPSFVVRLIPPRGRSRRLLHHRRRPPPSLRRGGERGKGRVCAASFSRFCVSCFPLSCAHDEVNAAVSGNHSAQPPDWKPKRGVLKRALMIEEDAEKKIDVESDFFIFGENPEPMPFYRAPE